MIVEKPISGFNNKLKYDKLNYPQCSCGNCPRFYMNAIFCGARQSGKTFSCISLLRHYEENNIVKDGEIYPLRVILISPTIEANPIWKSLKSLDFDKDIYDEYTYQVLLDIIEDIKETKKECEDFKEYRDFYKIFIKTPESKLSELYDKNPEAFMKLEKEDFAHYNDIPQPRYKNPPVTIIILDDMMCQGAFSNKAKSTLTNAYIKNRHMQICFFSLVQSLKSIPKNQRLNTSLFFLSKFQNHKMVCEDLYEEISDAVSLEQFIELYQHATSEKYGALIMDLTNGKRFLKGWDTELSFGEKNNLDNNKEEAKE